MPMPRAKVQGLGAHVSNMVTSARGLAFGRNSQSLNHKTDKTKALLGSDDDDDDDSSSSSSSSSSDDDASESDGVGTEKFISKINSVTARKKAAAPAATATAARVSMTTNGIGKPSKPTSAKASHSKSKQKPQVKSADSSSEDESEEEKPKISATVTTKLPLKAKKTAAQQSSDSDSDSGSDSDSDSSGDNSDEEEKASSAKPLAPSTQKAPKDDSSSSDESDTTSDDETQKIKKEPEDSTKTGIATKTTATVSKRAKDVSESDSGSDSDQSDDEAEKHLKPKAQSTPAKKPAANKAPKTAPKTELSKTSKPAVGKKTASSVTKAVAAPLESPDDEMADESFAIVQENGLGSSADEFVRDGFQLRKASDDTDISEVVGLFENAKREGKQIWYFTTPASVPISVVEKMEFPVQKAQTGEAIVSHNGVDYGVDLGASGKPRTFKILVPASKGGKYEMLDRNIDHTMHLKRVTKLAASDFTAKPQSQVTAPKPPRPQPEGLKARYTPIGVPRPPVTVNASGVQQGGGVAMAEAADANASTSSKKSKKRKAGTEDAAKAPSSDKKTKKVKTINAIGADVGPASSPAPNSTPNLGSKKSQGSKGKAAVTPIRSSQTPVPLPRIPGLTK